MALTLAQVCQNKLTSTSYPNHPFSCCFNLKPFEQIPALHNWPKIYLLQPHFVGKERALSGLAGLDAISKAWSVVTPEFPFLGLKVHSKC